MRRAARKAAFLVSSQPAVKLPFGRVAMNSVHEYFVADEIFTTFTPHYHCNAYYITPKTNAYENPNCCVSRIGNPPVLPMQPQTRSREFAA